ncbi:hypothetical protein ACB094_01G216300 [Castanea mollissima]
MENTKKQGNLVNLSILQSEELYEYILATSVYPREPKPLKELRKVTAAQPMAYLAISPDAGQLIAMFLKIVNAKKTIEIGVFTGYSLLLTALTIPDDGKITAIDVDRTKYEIGLPIIQKTGVGHKINFIESQALPVLDELIQDPKNEGSFDFAFVDADKVNYWKYHERMMKLVKVGGIIIYDNTLWRGYVALPEEDVPEKQRASRQSVIEFNNSISADHRVEISHASVGDGVLICRRIC